MMTTSINYTLDVGFHSDSMYKSYEEITAAFLELLKTLVVSILGDFHMFFFVMGLEGDTVCANNATHPSRPG